MLKNQKLATVISVTSLSVLGVFAPLSLSFNTPETFVSVAIGNASAQAKMAYNPPGGRKRLQRTEGSGARGCTNLKNPVKLSLLTPNDHIALTTSARPTFLWHVSGVTEAPISFTITAPGAKQPIYQTDKLKANKAGIMKLELPTDVPELALNQQYRWTVGIICNKERPSENINARAWIERVPMTSDLKNKLAAAKGETQQALVFTQAGVWSDGISILNQVRSSSANQKQAANLFAALLEQVGLKKILN